MSLFPSLLVPQRSWKVHFKMHNNFWKRKISDIVISLNLACWSMNANQESWMETRWGTSPRLACLGLAAANQKSFRTITYFCFVLGLRLFFGWRQDGAHIQDWPGSCCCQPEERNILGLRLILFQKTLSATCKYTDYRYIYSGCGHVCWSKH